MSNNIIKTNNISFSQRINEIVPNVISAKKLAEALEIHRSTIQNYLNGKSEPNWSTIHDIARVTETDVGWLMGLSDEPVLSGPKPSLVPTDELSTIANDPSFSLVPRYDVSASAGHGSLIDQEAILGYMAFQTSWLRLTMGVNPDDLSLINAAGDSMEPTIRSGDLLLLDNSVNSLEDDGVYAIRINEFLSVKRLQLNYQGGIEIRGDNPLYNTQIIDQSTADGIQIVGRVLWFGRRL